MRGKKLIAILLLFFAAVAVSFFLYKYVNRVSYVVIMKDHSFEPSKFTIKKGDRVVFENHGTKAHWPASDYHPTHGIYPEFDPKEGISPGGQWAFVFDKVGRWRFHDHLNPIVRGVVIVTN